MICPECNFASEIPDDKIPAKAQLATCPKCQIKFRFRNLDPDENEEQQIETPQESQVQPVQSQENSTGDGFPTQQAPADTSLTNLQVTPEIERGNYSQAHEQTQDKDEKSDIWKSLGSMSPEENEINDDTEAGYEETSGSEIPFEVMEKYGFIPSFFLTIKKVIMSPNAFFTDMQLNGYLKPLLFVCLIMVLQGIFSYIWTLTGVIPDVGPQLGEILDPSMSGGTAALESNTAMLLLLIYPFAASAAIFPVAGITHIMLLTLGAGERGYQATFRATTYSYAPLIFCMVPVVGEMIGTMAAFVISIIAYKCIHNTSLLRVAIALIMPMILLFALVGLLIGFDQPTL